MALYQYKCNVCAGLEEKFLPSERRNEKFNCSAKVGINKEPCPGKMIFQPVQKTTFRMNKI